MGDLTKNFSRHEFVCTCGCGFDTVDFELVTVLQDVSNRFGNRPVIITGPNRCVNHNEGIQMERDEDYIPFSSMSEHLNAKAADFYVEGIHPDRVWAYLASKYPDKYGIGKYDNRTHVDVRPGKARWDNTGKS